MSMEAALLSYPHCYTCMYKLRTHEQYANIVILTFPQFYIILYVFDYDQLLTVHATTLIFMVINAANQ